METNRELTRQPNGHFAPGNAGGGRRKGSKNKLSKVVFDKYKQLAADGDFAHVMEQLKEENPAAFAKLVNDAAVKLMERDDKQAEDGGDGAPILLQVNFVSPGK